MTDWAAAFYANHQNDLTFAVGALGMVAAMLSAIFAWHIYRLQAALARRQDLTFEPVFRPVQGWPGCIECEYRIRNHEPVSAKVIMAVSRKTRVRLVTFEDAHESDQFGGAKLKERFPSELAKKRIELVHNVGASTDVRSAFAPGPVTYLRFYASGDVSPRNIKLVRRWADQV